MLLQSCSRSSPYTSDTHKLSGPEAVLAYTPPPTEEKCSFQCPQKDMHPTRCTLGTLGDLVDLLGPPDKVHNLVYHAADGTANVGVEFIYASKGANFSVYDIDADIRGKPERGLEVDDYECYPPSTLKCI